MAKLPTFEEMAQEVARLAVDECEYEGKTLREWIEIIKAQHGTNLAEVGTNLARTVKGFPIDADLLMLKVEEEYGFRARDRLYEIIRNMPKYELPSAQPKRGKWKNIVDGIEYTWGTCDTCGAHIPMPYKYYEYCPHCGTKNEVKHG